MEKLSDQDIGYQKMLARIERAKSLGIDPDRLNFVREKSSLSQFIKTKEQADHLMRQLGVLKDRTKEQADHLMRQLGVLKDK